MMMLRSRETNGLSKVTQLLEAPHLFVYACMLEGMFAHVFAGIHVETRGTLGILLCHSLPYFLKRKSRTDLGTRMVGVELQ